MQQILKILWPARLSFDFVVASLSAGSPAPAKGKSTDLKIGHYTTSEEWLTRSSRKGRSMTQSSKTEWEGYPRGFCGLNAPHAQTLLCSELLTFNS